MPTGGSPLCCLPVICTWHFVKLEAVKKKKKRKFQFHSAPKMTEQFSVQFPSARRFSERSEGYRALDGSCHYSGDEIHHAGWQRGRGVSKGFDLTNVWHCHFVSLSCHFYVCKGFSLNCWKNLTSLSKLFILNLRYWIQHALEATWSARCITSHCQYLLNKCLTFFKLSC